MTLFALHLHHNANPWNSAPIWAIELREMIIATMNQNELILAKLNNRATYLTPEDQAKLNEIFDTSIADTAKIDAAK